MLLPLSHNLALAGCAKRGLQRRSARDAQMLSLPCLGQRQLAPHQQRELTCEESEGASLPTPSLPFEFCEIVSVIEAIYI